MKIRHARISNEKQLVFLQQRLSTWGTRTPGDTRAALGGK
jgi:hypothetical protein